MMTNRTLNNNAQTLKRVLMLSVVMTGCAAENTDPSTERVTGAVTYQGKPADGVTLMFHAVADGAHALAVTDESGEFDVSTYFDMGKREQPGMVAGEYRVTASKLDVETIRSTMQPPKNLLPEKYNSPELSSLTANVIPGEENRFKFELK